MSNDNRFWPDLECMLPLEFSCYAPIFEAGLYKFLSIVAEKFVVKGKETIFH